MAVRRKPSFKHVNLPKIINSIDLVSFFKIILYHPISPHQRWPGSVLRQTQSNGETFQQQLPKKLPSTLTLLTLSTVYFYIQYLHTNFASSMAPRPFRVMYRTNTHTHTPFPTKKIGIPSGKLTLQLTNPYLS